MGKELIFSHILFAFTIRFLAIVLFEAESKSRNSSLQVQSVQT
jgi:hypothetical protein